MCKTNYEKTDLKKVIVAELVVGILMLVSALYTYIPEPQYMHELTFLSNMAGAGIFIADGLCQMIRRKQLPGVLFLIETATISIVFLITVGCTVSGLAHFNFSGGMFFLHIINPILVIGFFLLFRGEREFKIKKIAVAPLFVTIYLLFDYIRFLFVGDFVYGLFPAEGMNLFKAIVIGVVAYIIVDIWGLVLYSIARIVRNRG